VRYVEQKSEAGLTFWTEVVTSQLLHKGYGLVARGTIDGDQGAWLRFRYKTQQHVFGIVPRGPKIFLIETDGPEAQFKKVETAVLTTIEGTWLLP